VEIVERECFPRERPGETLHPGVEILLDRLGVLDAVSRAGFMRHAGIRVHWDQVPRFVPYGADASGRWRGFQAWRATLDVILLARAVELGATLRQPCRALRPIFERGRVCGVETSRGRLKARLVVDAAGAQHWLARRSGIGILAHSPRLVARYGYRAERINDRRADRWCADFGRARLGAPAGEEIEAPAPILTAERAGWTWTAQVAPRLHAWTRLALGAAYPDPKQVPPTLGKLEPRGHVRGADVSWRVLRSPAGAGYMAVGDAAATLDPSSSHGVLKALMSGLAVADLAIDALTKASHEAQAIERYNAWVRGLFDADAAELRRLYSRLQCPPRWVVGSPASDRCLRSRAAADSHSTSLQLADMHQGRQTVKVQNTISSNPGTRREDQGGADSSTGAGEAPLSTSLPGPRP